MPAAASDSFYILRNLIEKDFKVRYRNMSLGILWSLLNPLVMMGVLTFVFTRLMSSDQPYFPLFLLMGLLPYNFFSLGWISGTTSVIENGAFVKKVPFRRELLPIASVLGNTLNYLIQLGLLLIGVAAVIGFTRHWAWLPVIVLLQVIFTCGISLFFSALDVYYRDTRYVVESASLVLFWVTPIFYSFSDVAPQYAWIYELNPMAAVVLLTRATLLEGHAPNLATLYKLAAASAVAFAIGMWVFGRLKKDFSDYL